MLWQTNCSDSAQFGKGATGGLIRHFCGYPLAQAALVCGAHSPLGGTQWQFPLRNCCPRYTGLAREARDLVPMGLAPERANMMARGLPPNVIATIQSAMVPPHKRAVCIYPQCIYTCVLCLSVASSFSFVKPTSICPLSPVCSCSCFLVFPSFDLSACPDPEPACRSIPCQTALDY